MVTPVIVLATYCLLHLLIFKRQGIIKDEGIIKSIFFIIGTLLYFSSNYFSSHMSLLSCNLHFSLKHIGIVMIYFIVFVFIYSGSKMGVDKNFEGSSINSKLGSSKRISVIGSSLRTSNSNVNLGSNSSINGSNSNIKALSNPNIKANSNSNINVASNSNINIATDNSNNSIGNENDINKIILKKN